MTNGAASVLYSVTSSGSGLTLSQVWTGSLGAGYEHVLSLTDASGSFVVGVNAAGVATASSFGQGSSPFAPAQSNLELGRTWDAIVPFQLGGSGYLLAYGSADGTLAFFPLGAGLTTQTPYELIRKRPPAVTAGFDTVAPIVVNRLVYVLGYSAKTGDVNIYSLSPTAGPAPGSPPGTPALSSVPVWAYQWAADWTRFAFFQLGAETFFLKTNVGKLNVNIDHVFDDPSRGTVEVGTYLELQDALALTLVRAFYLDGDPYFVAYKPDGSTVVYRFRGDCQGWTQQAALTAPAATSEILPLTAGGATYLLFYAEGS